MEPRFRPIPITILDFMAVFLPGSIWLILIVTSFEFLSHFSLTLPYVVSPVIALENIGWATERIGPLWLSVPMLIIVSLLIGYVAKPLAMRWAERLSRKHLRKRLHDINEKRDRGHQVGPRIKEDGIAKLEFPFNELHEGTPYFERITRLLRDLLKVEARDLPSHHQPFSTAKRFLRCNEPQLWEESERFEAEVRMTGVLLLAAFYSFVMSLLTLIHQSLFAWLFLGLGFPVIITWAVILALAVAGFLSLWFLRSVWLGFSAFLAGILVDKWFGSSYPITDTLIWVGSSLISFEFLSKGFEHVRWRELSCTYVNFLITYGCHPTPGTDKSRGDQN